ncbi:MAG: phage tail sheath subtilisin-like domain-containing protein [Anaerolineales bacterium]
MPVTPTYPGVYIEEIPSGVRTLTGVATSITAFAGWAPKGPVDKAQLVLNWADYERIFGGLHKDSYLGYAVNQFFASGGGQAYIIRLVGSGNAPAAVTIDAKLNITAKNPGLWANSYTIATAISDFDATRFSLSVVETATSVTVEKFVNLSMSASDPRFVESLVGGQSEIINAVKAVAGDAPPTNTSQPLTGGANGTLLEPNAVAFENALTATGAGINYLDRIDLFNILCVPGETKPSKLAALQKFCRDRRAFLIIDCASDATLASLTSGPDTALTGADSINSAFYFPWVNAPDPLREGRPRLFPPSGMIAGIYARTDSQRGVWKAPAGTEASLGGIESLSFNLSDPENGILNPQAINCLRSFPVYGPVVWGARTLAGNDQRGSEWKYVPVRRFALFIEESLYRGTQWVVFEPNDEPLWAQIRLNVGAFMHDLFRQGAFQGSSPREAYFVKCDNETTTQSDINRGVVNILVGFAPLKPAEFVIIQIQQMAGQIQA